MLGITRVYLVGIILAILFTSCSNYEKVKKSSDVNMKLSMADKYYEKKDYVHARDLYENLMPMIKGTKNFEPLYFKYAMTLFNLRDYNGASYHFKNFTSSFPNSKNTEEAAYMNAYSIYKMSPKITVNQSTTEKGLEVLQNFNNTYTKNTRNTEVNTYIKSLQDKLEKKSFIAAQLYYDIGQYKAAVVMFKNTQADYPLSANMDLYQYMIVKSYYKYAKSSTREKQEERFVNTIAAYQDLVDNYPKSKYLKDAETYFTLSTNNLKNLKK